MARLSPLAAALLIASFCSRGEASAELDAGRVGGARSLTPCPTTNGCLVPKFATNGFNVSTISTFTFSGAYAAYASTNGAQFAYGIMLAIDEFLPFNYSAMNFNYRNISVQYVIGDVVNKNVFAYNITFSHVNASLAAAALGVWSAVLPQTNVGNTTDRSIIYQFNMGDGGGLANLNGIYPGYGPTPYGSFNPPPSPSPRPPPPSPPPSPLPPLPSPPPAPPIPTTCRLVSCFSFGNLNDMNLPINYGSVGQDTIAVSGTAAVVAYTAVHDGLPMASVPNGIIVTTSAPVSSAAIGLLVEMNISYSLADNHYRHLFNLDGFSAVLHQTATQTEVWVGNNNGDSSTCARGFKVDGVPGWPLNTFANVTLMYNTSNAIGDLLVNGVPMPPAIPTGLVYFETVNCLPIFIPTSTQVFVGASGNVGYNDNFVGTITFIGLNYSYAP
jgi:hypothetical protein